jgi:hypothetical protein
LTYSGKDEQTLGILRKEVIFRLHKADLQGDIKKSQFNVTQVHYLGMALEAGDGISIVSTKATAIRDSKFEDLTATDIDSTNP